MSNIVIKREKSNENRRASVAQLVRRRTLATSDRGVPPRIVGAQVQILVDASCGRLPMHTRPGWTIQSSPTTWSEAVVSGQQPDRPGAVVPGRPTGLDQSRPTDWTGLVRPSWLAWNSPGQVVGPDRAGPVGPKYNRPKNHF